MFLYFFRRNLIAIYFVKIWSIWKIYLLGIFNLKRMFKKLILDESKSVLFMILGDGVFKG